MLLNLDKYVEFSTPQKKLAIEYISKYAHYLDLSEEEDNGVIMDIGCGDGYTTANTLKPFLSSNCHNGTLIGVDIEKKSIDYARRTYEKSGIKFNLMDVTSKEDTRRYANTVDIVFSLMCLHWCPDLKICFENMHGMLKPGGHIFCSFLTKFNPLHLLFDGELISSKWKDQFTGQFKKMYFSQIFQLDKPDVYVRSILEDCNFEVILCEVVPLEYIYHDVEELIGFFHAFPGLYQHLPQHMKEELSEELRTATTEKLKTLKYTLACVLLIARKK